MMEHPKEQKMEHCHMDAEAIQWLVGMRVSSNHGAMGSPQGLQVPLSGIEYLGAYIGLPMFWSYYKELKATFGHSLCVGTQYLL